MATRKIAKYLTMSLKETIAGFKNIDYADYIKSIMVAVLLAMLFRSVVVEPYSIPTGSMHPQLLEGDYLFATKFSYGYGKYSFFFGNNLINFNGRIMDGKPERGDIVIFRGTKDSRDYIKRLIGLPGDKIQLISKVLYINGNPVPRLHKQDHDDLSTCNNHARSCKEFTETLPNGVTYSILQADVDGISKNSHTDTTIVYKVPEGHYFFMGDNRDNSIDSRFLDGSIAFVPQENIIAKAKFLVFTTDISNLLKGRLFKIIQ